MHELNVGKTVDLNRARRERAQPFEVVRAELLPFLQDRFNPNVVDALADQAELAMVAKRKSAAIPARKGALPATGTVNASTSVQTTSPSLRK